jgi:uncharacterized protein YndB with AHSA1/START domain
MTSAAPAIRSVIVEREVAHPPEKLWRALTQPHLIQEWLMKNDFAPVAGHQFTMGGDWGSVDCTVLEVEPHRTLSYSWAAFGLDSVVTFTLTPTPRGTRLRLEQAGFRLPEQEFAFQGAQQAWPEYLDHLEDLLAREG